MTTRQGIFVTGTDTGIGKTLTSTLLAYALAQSRRKTGYFKPVQTGDDLDTDVVRRWAPDLDFEIAPPVYSFREPIAPNRAARKEGKAIELKRIEDAWRNLAPHPWVIEGAGGVLAPLTETETIRDLIACLGVPVLVVASTRLGTINHTLLTLEALQAARRGTEIGGIVLNGEEDPGLAETLAGFTRVPVVANVPPFPRVTPGLIRELAPLVFPKAVLEALFG